MSVSPPQPCKSRVHESHCDSEASMCTRKAHSGKALFKSNGPPAQREPLAIQLVRRKVSPQLNTSTGLGCVDKYMHCSLRTDIMRVRIIAKTMSNHSRNRIRAGLQHAMQIAGGRPESTPSLQVQATSSHETAVVIVGNWPPVRCQGTLHWCRTGACVRAYRAVQQVAVPVTGGGHLFFWYSRC